MWIQQVRFNCAWIKGGLAALVYANICRRSNGSRTSLCNSVLCAPTLTETLREAHCGANEGRYFTLGRWNCFPPWECCGEGLPTLRTTERACCGTVLLVGNCGLRPFLGAVPRLDRTWGNTCNLSGHFVQRFQSLLANIFKWCINFSF